jgi:putative transposase
MPRLARLSDRGLIWHITHRCHDGQFLLKFLHDRRAWLYWLREARLRFDLCVLNYVVTSNHVHLLVQDQGNGEIATSMQLIAGRTAQQYNERKRRHGAFWQERYRVTAIDNDAHLARCLIYIDLNMVRAGAVGHPAHWAEGGYNEIQRGRQRYRSINLQALSSLLGFRDPSYLRQRHCEWVDSALRQRQLERDRRWTESLAVGSAAFVARVQRELGVAGAHRRVHQQDDSFMLRERRLWFGTSTEESQSLLAHNGVPLELPSDARALFPPVLVRPDGAPITPRKR